MLALSRGGLRKRHFFAKFPLRNVKCGAVRIKTLHFPFDYRGSYSISSSLAVHLKRSCFCTPVASSSLAIFHLCFFLFFKFFFLLPIAFESRGFFFFFFSLQCSVESFLCVHVWVASLFICFKCIPVASSSPTIFVFRVFFFFAYFLSSRLCSSV